jgi:hypothetical protein
MNGTDFTVGIIYYLGNSAFHIVSFSFSTKHSIQHNLEQLRYSLIINRKCENVKMIKSLTVLLALASVVLASPAELKPRRKNHAKKVGYF